MHNAIEGDKESWEEAEARKAREAWQAKFDAVDWAKTEEMYGIWPIYMQEQVTMWAQSMMDCVGCSVLHFSASCS